MTGDIDGWFKQAGERARDLGVPDTVALKMTRPAHPGGGHVLDFDGEHVIGQFIVWPSGSIEASAVVIEMEERAFVRDAVANDVSELDSVLEDLSRAIRTAEVGR